MVWYGMVLSYSTTTHQFFASLFCRLEPIQDKIIDSIFRFQFSASDINVGGRLSKFTANHFNKNPDTRFEIAKRQTNNDRNGW
jgi:hypothetical protein